CAFRQGPKRRKNRCCRDHCVVQGSSDAQRPPAFKVAAKPAPPHVFVRMHAAISDSGRALLARLAAVTSRRAIAWFDGTLSQIKFARNRLSKLLHIGGFSHDAPPLERIWHISG